MPRNAGARVKRFWVVAALAALVAGCDDDSPVATEAGASPPKDAGHDAAMVEDAGKDSGTDASDPPWSEPDGSIIDSLMDEYCVLQVAATCDGPEDCKEGGNQRACCARFEPSQVAFTTMECADSCDFKQTFPLCHEGQVCTADGQATCRTSLLIPHDFIGVCAPRTSFSRPPTGEAVEGMIDCGSQQCVVGEEQCCLREGFNVRRLQPVKYESYCAPIGELCDCTDVDIPPRDSGMSGDDDAGL